MTTTRAYASYDDYVAHQAEKLEQSGGEAFTNPEKMVGLFVDRFQAIELPPSQWVLCLGARRGEEVRAWRALGHRAHGIDLNPGSQNIWVRQGDFHDTGEPAHSYDVVYTNSVDHSLDWTKLADEMHRVVRPGGWIVLDLQHGTQEGYQFGEHDCLTWETARGMAEQIAQRIGWRIVSWRNLDRGTWRWGERLRQQVFGRRLHPFVYQAVLRA